MLISLFFICQPSWETTQTLKWPQSEQTCFLIEKNVWHIQSHNSCAQNSNKSPSCTKFLAFQWLVGHYITWVTSITSFFPQVHVLWPRCPSCLPVLCSHQSFCTGCSLCLVPSPPDLQTFCSLTLFMILFKSHPLNDFYLTPSIKNYNQIVKSF